MSHQSDSSLLDVLLIGKEIRVTLSYFKILVCTMVFHLQLSVIYNWMCRDVGADMLSTTGCVGRIYVRVDICCPQLDVYRCDSRYMLFTIGCVDIWE